MSIVSWLLSRVYEDDDGSVEVNTLFNAFDFEMKESGVKTLYSKRLFVDYIVRVYPKAVKERISTNVTVTNYKGICLRALTVIELKQGSYNAEEIKKYLPGRVQNVESSKNSVTFSIGTSHLCDGNEVIKRVTLFFNGTWSLNISGTEIDLDYLHIGNQYSPTEQSIGYVIRACDMTLLCEGIKVTKTVIVSRYHVLNRWRNTDGETRRIHSVVCNRVVPLNKLSGTCIKCLNMTFHYKSTCKQNRSNKENEPEHTNQTIKVSNNNDNTKITKEAIQALVPGAKEEMVQMLLSQAENVSKHPKGRRWNKDIIIFCLQWYCKSPKSYESVRESGYLLLPSKSLLIQYKTKLKQGVGFDENMFKWMYDEAEGKQLCQEGYMGGLIIDEMAIQSDIEITKCGDVVELVGLTDVGEEGNLSYMLRKGKNEQTIGTHALQLVFLGVTGFRFPIAHFISDGVQAPELYSLFWETVDKLHMFGFKVLYTCLDGAQSNRSFIKINLGQHPVTFKCSNPCNFSSMVFMMDFSHVIKKIRNNIIKSGISAKSTRNLILTSGNSVQWQMFIDCYHWDKTNALQLHRKLTNEHLFPSNQSKMRNHLAEQVLDSEMLNLFVQYQQYLGEKGSILNGVMELLKKTSKFIEIFRDMRPVKSKDDHRLSELLVIANWFDDWEKWAKVSTIRKNTTTMILSHQAHEDIQSCIIGFIELCEMLLTSSNKIYITPGLINSDVVENTFNQQRSTYNGANTNPSALQYRRSLNSILLGQNIVSQKGNAGKNCASAQPYNLTLKKEPRKRPSSETSSSSIKVIRI